MLHEPLGAGWAVYDAARPVWYSEGNVSWYKRTIFGGVLTTVDLNFVFVFVYVFVLFMDLDICIRTLREYDFLLFTDLLMYECYDIFS